MQPKENFFSLLSPSPAFFVSADDAPEDSTGQTKIKESQVNKISQYNRRYLKRAFPNRLKIFKMTSAGKIVLCLAVVFCLVQAIAARPKLDSSFLENVRYDLVRKCASLEKDMDKEAINVKHKLAKESFKLLKKAVKEGSPECIESAKVQSEEQLDEKTQEIHERLTELKESLETGLQPDSTLPEITIFRNDFKRKLQDCKKTSKAELKDIEKSFSSSGKACLA